MKMLEQGHKTASRGVQRRRAYRVAQSSKVMDMFSNMLYSDKIKAPVRELSTNAWDAHVDAGNTSVVPEMHLPTYRDLEFRLRDFGTGLSKQLIEGLSEEEIEALTPEQLENMTEVELYGIYGTYGESNKTDSNDFNGCMGIGSKSPFAYARSFTTTSYYNGMKYVYVNSKDEHNMPNLELIYEGATDEPNGLEIGFAVEAGDIGKFEAAARQVLQWFPKLFNVRNGNVEIVPDDYVMKGDNWRVRKHTNESRAIMGYIEYPIEKRHFSDKRTDKPNDWYTHYNDSTPCVRLLGLGLELHFDIGEVEMDISREALQYNPVTVKHIRERLDKVLKEIGEQISLRFKDCKSYWDACILFNELKYGELRSVEALLALSKTEYQGVPLKIKLSCDDIRKAGFIVQQFHRKHGRGSYRTTSFAKRSDNPHQIDTKKNIGFFINDVERGAYVACCRAIEADKYSEIFLFGLNGKTKQQLADTLGCQVSDLQFVSSLPKPPKQKRLVNRDKVFKWTGGGYGSNSWDADSIDIKDGGIFLEINSWRGRSGPIAAYESTNEIKRLIRGLEAVGIKVPDVYGIKSAVVQKYRDSNDWETFHSWAKKQLQAHIAQHNYDKYVQQIHTLESFLNSDFYLNLTTAKVNIADSKSPLKILLDKLQEYAKVRKQWEAKLDTIRAACGSLGISFSSKKASDELTSLEKQAKQRYDAVFTLTGTYGTGYPAKCTAIVNLVNLIDKKG